MSYNHKLISDLAWAIGSASLLTGTSYKDDRLLSDDWFSAQLNSHKELLSEQDKAPQKIQAYLSKMPYFKLGHYFENLIAYWFLINPDFEILYRNLVVTDDKRTIGELDFLIKEHATGKVIHVEVAVKFFLQINVDNKSQYLGPNLNDNLDKKFDKLINKQIELSNHLLTKKKLDKKGLTVDEHWVILKGRLYSSNHTLDKTNSWLSLEEFLRYKDEANSSWIILSKTHWLAEVENIEYNFLDNEVFDKALLDQYLLNHLENKPLCLVKVNNDKETLRLFVTPDDWRQRAEEILL